MAKPTDVPRWADTVPANRVEPANAKKDVGWAPAEKPPAQYENWMLYTIYTWIIWLNDFEITAHIWAALQTFTLGVVVTQSTADSRAVDATGNGTGAGVRGTGGATSAAGVEGIGGAPNGAGVQGSGTGTGAGVVGVSAAGPGVRGTGGTSAAGVEGVGNAAAAGVKGTGGSSDGPGVQGIGGAGSGVGVLGTGVSLGVGVHGVGGPGAIGVGAFGVLGEGTLGAAGVKGVGGPTDGAGVQGEGVAAGAGIKGIGGTTGGHGVHGIGGTGGTGGITDGHGVFGEGTDNGEGLRGVGGSNGGHGCVGTGGGNGSGVSGVGGPTNGTGVQGIGTGTGPGVKAFKDTGNAIEAVGDISTDSHISLGASDSGASPNTDVSKFLAGRDSVIYGWGSVPVAGTSTNRSRNVNGVARPATGQYVITMNTSLIDDDNVSVWVTPETSDVSFKVATTTVSSKLTITINFRTIEATPAPINTAFRFGIVGD